MALTAPGARCTNLLFPPPRTQPDTRKNFRKKLGLTPEGQAPGLSSFSLDGRQTTLISILLLGFRSFLYADFFLPMLEGQLENFSRQLQYRQDLLL